MNSISYYLEFLDFPKRNQWSVLKSCKYLSCVQYFTHWLIIQVEIICMILIKLFFFCCRSTGHFKTSIRSFSGIWKYSRCFARFKNWWSKFIWSDLLHSIAFSFRIKRSAEEQKDLLSPVLGNILKMTIRTLSSKRTKKIPEPLLLVCERNLLISIQWFYWLGKW